MSERHYAATEMPVFPRKWHILPILCLLMGYASISTDFYLPAMPAMAAALGAELGQVEFTISGYLLGFSLGQLFWGPVSDRFGRRLPIAAGLVLFIAGSAGCALSGNIEAVIGWRIIQALGASASVVLARAMVRDLYEGPQAAQMLSVLLTMMAVAPLIGPAAGAQIANFGGWRTIFWVLVAVGAVTMAALFSIPETLPPARRNNSPPGRIILRYGQFMTRRKILGYAGASGFFYAGMFAYIAGTPAAFIGYHHVSTEQYALLFGAGILGIMGANIANARMVRSIGIDRSLFGGTLIAGLAGTILAVTACTDFGGLRGLFLPLLVFVSCTGFIVANSVAGALADYPTEAGAISALMGAFQYGSGIVGSGLVGAFADGTAWPMGWVIALSGLGSLLCAGVLLHEPQRIVERSS